MAPIALMCLLLLAAAASAVRIPVDFDAGFWYGTFDVGLSQGLSLLIDSASADLGLNPDVYKPSAQSVNLQKSGQLKYGTTQENGCGNADIAYNVYSDSVSIAGLTASNQTFAAVYATPPPDNNTVTQFPHQGLIGFAGLDSSELSATPFFHNLCDQGVVSACRFALAFKTDGTGQQVLGELDSSLFSGSLTTQTISDEWIITADIVVGTTIIAENQQILLDSGTANLIGPPDQVQKIFDVTGIQGVNQSLPGCTKVLTGYYPCVNPLSNFGIAFPSGSSNYFNIEPSAFQEADDGNGNCTATISGIEFGGWVFGQSWFQGKYVDFQVSGTQGGAVGIAQLNSK